MLHMNNHTSRKLKMLGMVLFLLGLLTGFGIMGLKNPRMGLAAHLEGVMNGSFLVLAGLIWNELLLSNRMRKILFWTLLYGTFANWLFTLLAALFGTSEMTPLSGAGYTGTAMQESLVNAGLITIGLTMVFSLVVMIYGLRGKI
jgi:hydroxylaminobenzene mutase